MSCKRAGDTLKLNDRFVYLSQKKLVSEAVQKDTEGDYKAAVQLYCDALAFFVPAIHCKWYPLTLYT